MGGESSYGHLLLLYFQAICLTDSSPQPDIENAMQIRAASVSVAFFSGMNLSNVMRQFVNLEKQAVSLGSFFNE